MSRIDPRSSASSENGGTPLPSIRNLPSDAASIASSLDRGSVRGRDRRVNMSMDSLAKDPVLSGNRTFVTESHSVDRKSTIPPFVTSDLKLPNRGHALLVIPIQCHVPKWPRRDLKSKDMIKDLKLNGPFSVILLAGVENEGLSKLLIGLVRAAYRTDSVIVDEGGFSGLEAACMKNSVALMGIAAEDSIVYPVKTTETSRVLLTPGHTHLITLGNKGDRMAYEEVAKFKAKFLKRLTQGRRSQRELLCVVAGDSPHCLADIEVTLALGGCVLALEATRLGRNISAFLHGASNNVPQGLVAGVMKGRVFAFPKGGNADHLSAAAYAYLTVHVT